MTVEELERATYINKNLLPKINVLENMNKQISVSDIGLSLNGLTMCDGEFAKKFSQLISDTKKRLEKEFNEL
nr:MAG TPA: hypothetical protein [Bacteriophage sp.]